MQGFLSVMEAYLAKTVGLVPADIDTGKGVVVKADVPTLMELAKQGCSIGPAKGSVACALPRSTVRTRSIAMPSLINRSDTVHESPTRSSTAGMVY